MHSTYNGSYGSVSIDFAGSGLPEGAPLFNVESGASVTVSGDWTSAVSLTETKDSKTITAGADNASLTILGSIDAVQVTGAQGENSGAPAAFTAKNHGQLNLGRAGTRTRIWSGPGGGAIGVEGESSLTIDSTHNRIVGTVRFFTTLDYKLTDQSQLRGKISAYKRGLYDLLDEFRDAVPEAIDYAEKEILAPAWKRLATSLGAGSTIRATFDGADSYWFGDEYNGNNLTLRATVTAKKADQFGIDDVIENALNTYVLRGTQPESGGNLEVTFRNGAQWSYFGVPESLEDSDTINMWFASRGFVGMPAILLINDILRVRGYSIPKRISSITLEEGGVINLYDVDDPAVSTSVKARWREIGLDKVFPEVMAVKHDYVRIGDLKGNGGIFRLDLDVDNKADSDMIFIENSSTGGTFSIEPYNLENLGNVSETNTLRFASVSKAARDKVNFTDTVNIKGEYLKDYQLLIGSEDYDPASEKNADYEDRVKPIETVNGEYQTFKPHGTEVENEDGSKSIVEDVTSLIGGKNWFIYRIVESENENVTRLNANPEAGWDYARTLDRLHHRLGEIRYSDPTEKGLWARARYERLDQHQVNLDRTMVQVGADFRNTERNRVGLAFDYNWGDADFDHVKGQNDITGYNLMFYDTWLKENGAWVDLTASIGRMKTETETVLNNGQSVTADYSQHVYKLGIEAGHKFDHKTESATYFVEPQLQLQYTRLGGKSYTMSNGFAGKLSSASSLIGRAGVRLGREWTNDKSLMNNAYFVADMLHEFGHGQDSYLYAGNQTVKHRIGGTGTWFDAGVSGQWRTSERTAMHFDLLKYFGGGFGNAWMAGVNLRYAF